ncbi:Hypothetical predicted protein [Olea europaea subsp. europaea]|uniref:Uncharacterized protein n=1 Tax=Olea europaea subsp. europaea TaxID=158383 RepID=A0A8S0URU7_OLEEU|nr:Hypothetical predicted protein [Olea europaea subsp. europaea]
MSIPSSAGSVGLGPMREEDSMSDVPMSNVLPEDPVDPDERPINLSDEELTSVPSAYFGSCSKMNDEDVDEEDPSYVISTFVDERSHEV